MTHNDQYHTRNAKDPETKAISYHMGNYVGLVQHNESEAYLYNNLKSFWFISIV